MLDTRVAPQPYPSVFAPAPSPATEEAPERRRPSAPKPGMRGTVLMIVLGLVAAHGYLGKVPMVPQFHLPGIPAVSMLVATPPRPIRAMPAGKGMWIWQYGKTEGGDVHAIVARAKAVGLTHLYLRVGSHWDGFYGGSFMDKLLPVAHEAGLLVFGWDFPRLGESVDGDIERATAIINYETPGRHRLDGFSADIETASEGTHITAESASAYGRAIRDVAGPDFSLIACVPRPSAHRASYPYAEVVESFDAIAPMVYWLNRQPDSDVVGAVDDLAQFGKPIFPIGQAYDGLPEGGRRGVPPPEELWRFFTAANSKGVGGVSFWSWQAADQPAWDAIRDAVEFKTPG